MVQEIIDLCDLGDQKWLGWKRQILVSHGLSITLKFCLDEVSSSQIDMMRIADYCEPCVGASDERPLLIRFADSDKCILIRRERFAICALHCVRSALGEAYNPSERDPHEGDIFYP